MPKRKPLKIRNVILCEEVRQEKSGKFLLVGVFAADILVRDIPATVPISIYMDGEAPFGEGTAFVRLSGPGEGSGTMAIGFRKDKTESNTASALYTPRIEVLLEQEGTLKAEISEDNEHWSPLFEKRVIHRPDIWQMFPNVSAPPAEQSPPDAPETSFQP